MAQTTGAISQTVGVLEVSTNGSSWTDISGETTSVSFSGGDQLVGEQNTLDGDYPVVVGSGKKEARTATFSIVYTETASEAFDFIWDIWEAAGTSTVYVRYSPAGGQVGDLRFFASDDAGSAATTVPIASVALPDSDDGGGVTMAEFSVIAAQWVRETIV